MSTTAISRGSTDPIACLLSSLHNGTPFPSQGAKLLDEMMERRISSIPRQKLGRILLALAHVGISKFEDYDKILSYLTRTETAGNEKCMEDLKTFELLMRCGLVEGCEFSNFSVSNRKFLLRIRSAKFEPRKVGCPISEDVESILREACMRFDKVPLGPFSLRFARLGESGVTPSEKLESPISVLRNSVCVEVWNEASFMGKGLRPLAKIRAAILHGLKIQTVHVPHFDWSELKTKKMQKLYLVNLLAASTQHCETI